MKLRTRERYGFVAILLCIALVSLIYGIQERNYKLLFCAVLSVGAAFYFIRLTDHLDKSEKDQE